MVNLYLVYDKVAKEHGPLFEAKNDAIAKRMYANLMKNNPVPDDFLLVSVGLLNRKTPDAEANDVSVIPEVRIL